jgi:hypothetical protein
MTAHPSTVQRLSRWIRYAAIVFVASVLAIYVLTWTLPREQLPPGHHLVLMIHLAGLPANALSTMDFGDRALIASVSVPYLATLVWAFHRLVRMLKNFERGLFFERETVSDLRAFSGLLLVAKFLSLAAMHARVWLLQHLLGPGKKLVAVMNLSSDDLAILLLCALFFAIAGMMEEGRRISEENRGFV